MAEENKAMELHGEESEKKKYISDTVTDNFQSDIHEKRLLDWYLRISYHILTRRLLNV